MDLERIKQNLRLRSGRTKKARKPTKAPVAVDVDESKQTDSAKVTSNPDVSDVHASKAEKVDLKEEEQQQQQQQQQRQMPKPTEDVDADSQGKMSAESGHGQVATKDADGEQKVSRATNGDMPPQDSLATKSPEESPQNSQQSTNDLYDSDANKSNDALDFDLNPSVPKSKPQSIEMLSEHLFSAGHLNVLLHHPPLLARFTAFLNKYAPDSYPVLLQYIEASKAMAAIEYANAVAEGTPSSKDGSRFPTVAASLDPAFEESCTTTFKVLVDTVLPMYITYSLVKIVSECLVNEITGRSTPIMRNLVGGLSEVFCLTDPRQEDNPIIYASEEFYRLTGYGRDDVIGYNCRFLQGAKTKRDAPARLRASLDKGEETYETLLNYRRDGRPFINVLMIAPLHDDKGNVKYNIGAQIDVSGLVQGGQVLEGFQRYLKRRKADQEQDERAIHQGGSGEEAQRKAKTLSKLRDLSELFDLEESAVVHSHSRSSSMDRDDDTRSIASAKGKSTRKVLIASDASDEDNEDDTENINDASAWTLGQSGPKGLSGKLPGVYEKYMLIRAAPSLRIVFVSPKLRSYGKIVQSPFMSHVAGPRSTLSGLRESFGSGNPVSARIHFMAERGSDRDGTTMTSNTRHEDGRYGRACWISATPLLDGEDRVGVWMVVFVEKSQMSNRSWFRADIAQGSRQEAETQNTRKPNITEQSANESPVRQETRNGDMPIKPKRVDSDTAQDTAAPYRHPVAAPVEEYHSDEEAYEDVPRAHDDDQQKGSPQTPNQSNSADEYVQPRIRQSVSSSTNRVLIDPDSDIEHADATSSSSPPANHSSSPAFLPHDAPPSTPSEVASTTSPQSHTADVQPEKSAAEDEDNASSPTAPHRGSRPTSPDPSSPDDSAIDIRGQDKQGPVPAGLGYLDYLSKHNNRPRPSNYHDQRGRMRTRSTADDGDQSTDPDCERSPYSID